MFLGGGRWGESWEVEAGWLLSTQDASFISQQAEKPCPGSGTSAMFVF